MKTLTALADEFFDNFTLEGDDPAKAENDKICFKKSLDRFLATGNKEDAFVVYFCYSEIFSLFGEGYDNTRKLVELLSDHEYHSGELLSKHRDHYSHSVYVFALGLAIYACDPAYRNKFHAFYGERNDEKSAYRFLRLWGLVALFHDIGYPFQLAHEQIKNYTEELWGKNNAFSPFVSFGNLDGFTALSEECAERLQSKLGTKKKFTSIDELLSYGLKLREGYSEKPMVKFLRKRAEKPARAMDHGYFSAVILAKQFLNRPDFKFDTESLDVLTAILLHNNLNKYEVTDAHPIAPEEHPLAYLLMLCDELQNWDRLAYGKVSKLDPVAWDVELSIRENEIDAKYVFEICSVTDENGKKRLNKNFAEIQDGEFVEKIKKFVNSPLKITANVDEKPKNKKTYLYASDNNFINLCDFAKAIHASYLEYCKDTDASALSESFEKLPLEFKVSNIEQAKSYAYKLELINCFYSSKDLDYPVVEDFGKTVGPSGADNLGFLCREEHVRWVREKLAMGWKYGKDYKDNAERNAKKIHKDIVPFELLSDVEKKKDEIMINNIIPLLKKFGNNIRIYSYRTGRKPDLEIAGMGHRFFTDDVEMLKAEIKKHLLRYSEEYRVIVRTCFAYGADQLIAECANELGITTKAVLPTDYESYIDIVREDCLDNGHPFTEEDELRMRHLLAQTVVCDVVPDRSEFFYLKAGDFVINKCKKLIVLWDGQKVPLYDENAGGKFINRGGTYHCITMANQKGLEFTEDIHVIKCHR